MANSSNENLIIKLRGIAANIPKIKEEAGGMLVRNIRYNARAMFGNDPKYPYELTNSFQRDDVVYHDPAENAVFVKHPAAKRLEYGMGAITIKAKNAEFLHFKGKQGEDVYAKEVHINPEKPIPYARTAIKDTQKELQQRFKEVIK